MEITVNLMSNTPARRSARRGARAHFASATVGSSMVHVTAEGEIDAANALSLSKFVEAELANTSRLILDLRGLDFFGTQGFSMLHRINVMSSRHAVNWVVVPGEEVNRVLNICDPDGALPVAETLEEAMTAAIRPPRRHLRLVADD
jgi:anti-anti-sigma factor